MLSRPSSSFECSYKLLAERETTRLVYSQPVDDPTPQHTFFSVSRSLRNGSGNRYSNVLSYDRTCVASESQTYLNANVVSDLTSRWWIASQAPVPGSFQAFFHAIYSQSASKHPLVAFRKQDNTPSRREAILVQLTGWDEDGKCKADPYLPNVAGEPRLFHSKDSTPSIVLSATREDELPHLSTTLSRLHIDLEPGNLRTEDFVDLGPLMIWHYAFDAWPDHGVPTGPANAALWGLVQEVDRQRGCLDDCEVWVHCSAGIGRTGTFIALSSLLGRPTGGPTESAPSPLGPLPEPVASDRVASTVDQLREWRGRLVQGPDQMRLIYQLAGSAGLL